MITGCPESRITSSPAVPQEINEGLIISRDANSNQVSFPVVTGVTLNPANVCEPDHLDCPLSIPNIPELFTPGIRSDLKARSEAARIIQ